MKSFIQSCVIVLVIVCKRFCQEINFFFSIGCVIVYIVVSLVVAVIVLFLISCLKIVFRVGSSSVNMKISTQP